MCIKSNTRWTDHRLITVYYIDLEWIQFKCRVTTSQPGLVKSRLQHFRKYVVFITLSKLYGLYKNCLWEWIHWVVCENLKSLFCIGLYFFSQLLSLRYQKLVLYPAVGSSRIYSCRLRVALPRFVMTVNGMFCTCVQMLCFGTRVPVLTRTVILWLTLLCHTM